MICQALLSKSCICVSMQHKRLCTTTFLVGDRESQGHTRYVYDDARLCFGAMYILLELDSRLVSKLDSDMVLIYEHMCLECSVPSASALAV